MLLGGGCMNEKQSRETCGTEQRDIVSGGGGAEKMTGPLFKSLSGYQHE